MSSTWSNTTIIEFLNEVRLHPELWNMKNETYKDRGAKRDGWDHIAEKFGISNEEAYKKFKSLRTYAKNEEKKKKRGNKEVKWFAYDAISFILNEDTGPDIEHVDVSFDEKEIRISDIKTNLDQEENTVSEAIGSPFSAITKKPRICKNNKTSDLSQMRGLSEASDTVFKNEYAPFGEHIAYKLSRYDGYTRAQAEMKIAQVLYECDMQMLRSQNEELVPVTVLSDERSD